MKITIIYDNTIFEPGLQSDWGFAALIETREKTILFDTGSDGSILLCNMDRLSLNPMDITDVFISHSHFDHIGGLAQFLGINSRVTVFVPSDLRGIRRADTVKYMEQEPQELYPGIYTTGVLQNIEQSLIVKHSHGLALIVGCSHPDMAEIIRASRTFGRVSAIIGGMHGFKEFELLEDMDLICPTHCTRHIDKIHDLYPDSYVPGGSGRIIEL